ncbi:hypothetical protein BJ166DRAFT_490704 [Pestalotiopsis sp. NC0098]|nr:hypothetical protein BJ166DRAFT_490704 [Pestalotiopsis sp. NC0098]
MQIVKFVASSLAAASMATASPVAQDRNQTLISASTQGNNSNNAPFQVFGRSFAAPFSNNTYMQQHGVDRRQANEDGSWGRRGKIPYRKFPKCYVDCFDSEGVTSKTSMFIGDIRDLTTYEFCHSQQGNRGGYTNTSAGTNGASIVALKDESTRLIQTRAHQQSYQRQHLVKHLKSSACKIPYLEQSTLLYLTSLPSQKIDGDKIMVSTTTKKEVTT